MSWLYGEQGRFTWRMLATVLAGQAIVLLLGALTARSLADVRGGDAGRLLAIGLGLAALAIVAAGLLRRPYGITVGWVVQLATCASAWVLRPMAVVALIFGALWVGALVSGRRVDRAASVGSAP